MSDKETLLSIPAIVGMGEEPLSAVQYSVAVDDTRLIYGDQWWVRDGRALADAHPRARIQRRTITITYGEWEDVTP